MEPVHLAVLPALGVDRDDVLWLAGPLAGASTHPVARAIAMAARERLGDLPEVRKVVRGPGCGIRGTVAGRAVLVGNVDFVANAGCVVPGDVSLIEQRARASGRTPVVVAWDDTARAVLVSI